MHEEKQLSKRIVSDGSCILQKVVRKAYDEVKCASHVREEPLRQREEQVQRLTGGA